MMGMPGLAGRFVLAMLLLLTAKPIAVMSQPVEESRTRGHVMLNGVWAFVPSTDRSVPESGWGEMRVPGSWFDEKSVVRAGEWGDFRADPRKYSSGWYRTSVQVPEAWRGRSVVLDLRRISTDATVYVGAKRVGSVSFPGGEVDLTDHVVPGEVATVAIHVVATTNRAISVVLMGDAPGQNEVVENKLESAGLINDVRLVSRPKGSFVDGVLVRTSVRNRTLGLDIECLGVPDGAKVTVEAVVSERGGAEVRRFSGEGVVSRGVVQVGWPWADAKLWDLDRPNLYELKLRVMSEGMDDEVVERFGFREFWIEGRKYFLNGIEFRMRPDLVGGRWNNVSAEKLAARRAMGFNFGEFWPHELLDRGTTYEGWRGYAVADEAGFPISGLTPHMGWMGSEVNTPEKLEAFSRASRAEIRRHWNHPSILMWGTSGNMFGPLMDPALIGQREASEPGRLQRSPHMREPVVHAARGVAAMKAIDPTRPVFIHHGGATGDVYTMNHYLNLIPLQEREEWLSRYMKQGDMPMFYVEFGTPVYATVMRGRNGYGNTQQTEPLMSEYVASYLGSLSYRLEPSDYRVEIVKQYLGGQRYKGWHWDKTLKFAPNWLELQELFLTNTWQSWRTWGFGGGMIPWDDGYATLDGKRTVAGDALARVNGESLAWICGPEEAFTDRGHSFRAGQRVRKQVALLNDARETLPFEVVVKASLGGKEIFRAKEAGTIEVARDRFLPIEFDLPGSLLEAKTDGLIELESTIGTRKHTDRFEFRVFSAATPAGVARASVARVMLVDPKGRTREMLKGMGVETADWDGKPQKGAMLVVGREALEAGHPLPGNVDAFAKAGGRVLIMAQPAETLVDGLEARVAGVQSRRVFRVAPDHPVTAGLDDRDLSNWAGTGTLNVPYPDYVGDPRFNKMSPVNFPYYGWRWGNRHTVSSVAIEKPHRTGWTPILECEFDLAYSPLMELHRGEGKVVWCQLDLEDQVVADPAAERLARQLLSYVEAGDVSPRRGVRVAGRALALAEELGVRREVSETPAPGAEVWMVDGRETPLSEVEAYARGGGRVLVMHPQSGVGLKVETDESSSGSLEVPGWDEARGLSASDLRTRAVTAQRKIREAGGYDIGAGGLLARKRVGEGAGRGVIVLSTIDPSALEADTKTYHRLTRWRQTRAIAQVLANLGAEFEADGQLLLVPGSLPRTPVVDLSGAWRARLVLPMEAATSPDQKHADPGVSSEAQRVLEDPKAPFDAENADLPSEMEFISDRWKQKDGEAVFRRSFEVPEALLGRAVELSLGTLDDHDEVWINGTRVGRTGAETAESWKVRRVYPVPADLLRAKDNVVVVRIWDAFGGGGFTSNQSGDLRLRLPRDSGAGQEIRGLYHPDYRTDFDLGDDPYRYYNW